MTADCGNEIVDEDEECDDGNLADNDGCKADCTVGPDTRTRFNEVWPIFVSDCAACHTTGSSGGHQVGNANIDTAFTSSQQSAYSIMGTKGAATLTRILDGSMPAGRGCNPPMTDGTAGCPDAEDRALIQKWIDDGQLDRLK